MTRLTDHREWKCRSCGAVSVETELLTAPSPFDSTDTLTGCPECKGCSDGFDLLCDEDGCADPAGCGWPTGNYSDRWGGYRNTCGKHMKPSNPPAKRAPKASA